MPKPGVPALRPSVRPRKRERSEKHKPGETVTFLIFSFRFLLENDSGLIQDPEWSILWVKQKGRHNYFFRKVLKNSVFDRQKLRSVLKN
jgi:hypothetical protein